MKERVKESAAVIFSVLRFLHIVYFIASFGSSKLNT